jgi:hypothetical protein
MELFELERETLIDRKSCVRRAAALYELAIEYINRVEMTSDKPGSALQLIDLKWPACQCGNK